MSSRFDRAEREYFNRLEDEYTREDPECDNCGGTGTIDKPTGERSIDLSDEYDEDEEAEECERCEGSGFKKKLTREDYYEKYGDKDEDFD